MTGGNANDRTAMEQTTTMTTRGRLAVTMGNLMTSTCHHCCEPLLAGWIEGGGVDNGSLGKWKGHGDERRKMRHNNRMTSQGASMRMMGTRGRQGNRTMMRQGNKGTMRQEGHRMRGQ
jgi:hypothetical protein